ncbi:MAG TPA: plastocyanin/azurin family copper-binding protein [Gaiellales bacterium]|jgi:plastocyanin
MHRLLLIRSVTLVLLVGALALGAAACGGGSSGGGTTTTPATGGSSAATGTPVNVTLKDFSVTVDQSGNLTPGTYTFHVTNEGPSAHNLTVDGPDVEDEATPTFGSGSKDLTVTLKSGSYELYCSVPGHKQAGMETHITVGS